MDEITLEQTEEFHRFLQGEVPECMSVEDPPRLSSEVAYSVIWYLQEHLGVIPSKYERCKDCGSIYDSWSEGASIYCDQYCENCVGSHYPDDEDWEYGICDGCPHPCDLSTQIVREEAEG